MLPQVVTVPQKQVQYRKRDKLPAHGDIYPKQKNRTYSTETDTQSSLIVTYFIISRTWDRRPAQYTSKVARFTWRHYIRTLHKETDYMQPPVVTVPQKHVKFQTVSIKSRECAQKIWIEKNKRTYSIETNTQISLNVAFTRISRTWSHRPAQYTRKQ
jgi:hypothetical protein